MNINQVIELLKYEKIQVKFTNIQERDEFARLLASKGFDRGYLDDVFNYPESKCLYVRYNEVHVNMNRSGNIINYEDIVLNDFIDNAIKEYMMTHDIVGTRPFKVLVCPDEHHPNGYPSQWLRFKDGVLESEYTNGWNKEKASFLVEILSGDTAFGFRKGDTLTLKEETK